jgi:gamma-glutamyltranspeptidase/glutathione hydrolase
MPSQFLRSGSKESRHFIAETFRKALLQRRQRPYDPATYPPLSEEQLVTNRLAQALAASIRETIDPSLPRIDSRQSGGETTHLSVMDVEGNAVGITQSIELVYGSKAAADGLGFLYNNYMDSLDLNNPAHPFYLRPNASPWTSVAPALVFHNDALWMVTGSPGSERICSAISQFLVHMIDANLSMAEAVEQPRLHCSIGGKLSIEADRFAPDIPGYLGDMGYWLDPREPYAFYLGAIHAVLKCQTQTGFQGAAEVRRDRTAGGL